ncbi:helix-turn-helix transcriptional regulator [Natrialbaceae archaeon A-arb3/5]
MRLSTAVTLALTALLVTSTLGVAVAPAAASASAAESATASQPSDGTADTTHHHSVAADQSPLPPADPAQEIRINLSDDGDADWTIETRFLVTDEDDEELFFEYADSVVSGERDGGYNAQQFHPYADAASAELERDMSIEDTGWDDPQITDRQLDEDDAESDDEDEPRVGVISYSFTWTGFTTVENDRVHFGDVFQTSAGTAIDLDDGQRLVIESPADYGLETPTQLEWNGPHQFDDDELEIVFLRGPGSDSLVPSELLIPAAIVLLFVAGYVLTRYIRRSSGDPLDRIPIPLGSDARQDSDADESSATAADTDVPPDTTADGVDERRDGVATRIEYDEELDEDIDPELLSDEERVLRLLKQNGGRMKQATIVKETGWSNAKVSQLLSQMDDDEEIEKLRIGRENLITLPEVDPTEID